MRTRNPLLKREALFGLADQESMTMNGVVNKSGFLLLLCLISGAFGWHSPVMHGIGMVVAIVGGCGVALLGTFKPKTTPVCAPLYAIMEGLALGALSQIYNAHFHGLPFNAILITLAVLGIFLALYATRIVRVTPGMQKAVIAGTLGIFVVYFVDMLLGLFGHSVPFLNSSGPVGIIISLFICGIAAFNLFLDFNFIERYVDQGAPKYMEWYSGMALLITLVWLYLEVLRLLSKFNNR